MTLPVAVVIRTPQPGGRAAWEVWIKVEPKDIPMSDLDKDLNYYDDNVATFTSREAAVKYANAFSEEEG